MPKVAALPSLTEPMRPLLILLLFLTSLWLPAAAPATNAPPAEGNATEGNATDPAEDEAAAEEKKEEQKTWLSEFLESGPIGLLIKGGWFMAPILLLAILAFGVIIERWRSLKMLGTDKEALRQAVLHDLTNDRVEEALARYPLEAYSANCTAYAAGSTTHTECLLKWQANAALRDFFFTRFTERWHSSNVRTWDL